MKEKEFIDILKDALEIDSEELTEKTNLSALSEYDSLAIISIIVLVDEHFGEKLSAQKLATVTTVHSLMELIGIEKFED